MDFKLYLSAPQASSLPDEAALTDGLEGKWPQLRHGRLDLLEHHERRYHFHPEQHRGLEAGYHASDPPVIIVNLQGPWLDVVRLVEWVRQQVPAHVLDVMLQIEDQVSEYELRSAADLERLLDSIELYPGPQDPRAVTPT